MYQSVNSKLTSIYTQHITGHLCPRTTTVQNLLKRVLAQRVVLVRGTPAIGKSTLLQLLFHYVRDHPQRQPPICPFRISTWDKDRVMYSGNWRKYILHQTDGKLNLLADDQLPGQYLLMIDEAQSSYWDQQFWSDYVKQLAQGTWPTTAYLILFSSHGSHTELGAGIPAVTPPYLVPSQQVGLQKNAEDNPVGLLLTHEEFQDALQRKLATKTHPLRDTNSPEIEDYLFGITQGHAGALDGIIEALYAHQVSIPLRLALVHSAKYIYGGHFAPNLQIWGHYRLQLHPRQLFCGQSRCYPSPSKSLLLPWPTDPARHAEPRYCQRVLTCPTAQIHAPS